MLHAKKTTLNDLAHLIEKSFVAVAGDIADIKRDMATKEQLAAVQMQVSSIEAQLRETKIEIRLGNLEEKVFGSPPAVSGAFSPTHHRPLPPHLPREVAPGSQTD